MIYLRKLTIDDFDYLNSVENNKSFWKYSFQNQHYSNDELIQFIYDSQLPIEQTKQIRFVICKNKTIIKYASEDLNIKNLYCNISNDNTLSINFFKSVGFKEISKNSNLYVSSTDINYESIIQLQCI